MFANFTVTAPKPVFAVARYRAVCEEDALRHAGLRAYAAHRPPDVFLASASFILHPPFAPLGQQHASQSAISDALP